MLSNAARLNPSRWNIAISYCQDQLFVASRRSEHDLNDLCNIECWITKLLESDAERHAACYILIVWAGADTPSALPSWNLTPAAGHSGEASAGRGIQPNSNATQLCNLSSSSSGHTSWKQMNSHLCCYSQEACNIVRGYNSFVGCRGCYGLLSGTPVGGGTRGLYICDWIPLKLDEVKKKWMILSDLWCPVMLGLQGLWTT